MWCNVLAKFYAQFRIQIGIFVSPPPLNTLGINRVKHLSKLRLIGSDYQQQLIIVFSRGKCTHLIIMTCLFSTGKK